MYTVLAILASFCFGSVAAEAYGLASLIVTVPVAFLLGVIGGDLDNR